MKDLEFKTAVDGYNVKSGIFKKGTNLLTGIGRKEGKISGHLWEGLWLDDQLNGFGRQVWSAGYYIGLWKNGKKHGKGCLFNANGKVQDGIWEDDEFKSAE